MCHGTTGRAVLLGLKEVVRGNSFLHLDWQLRGTFPYLVAGFWRIRSCWGTVVIVISTPSIQQRRRLYL